MSPVSTHQHIPNLTQNNHSPIIRNEEQPWHSRTGQHARYHWSLVSNTYKLRFTQGLFIASLHWLGCPLFQDSPTRKTVGRDWWGGMKPLQYQDCLLFQQWSRSRITNDIMTILHGLQSSDVLPTHLLWYLVTDPAVNQGRVMGLEAHLPLSLANDLEGNRGCQCLQHVLHWQSSRALSKTLSYKLCRSLRF